MFPMKISFKIVLTTLLHNRKKMYQFQKPGRLLCISYTFLARYIKCIITIVEKWVESASL